ncbi:MAG TPA: adenosylcobinamide-phosphate synthase CbiB [Candidatus Wunengus californicus]|uniref:adenosylcobinamide-phosphate synthase CbiB n=1 Tax=Candidatus Wunengus californicus TaxID=3367619 RepID=UPI004027414E
MGLIELAVAFVLDCAIGDPQWSYHPMRLIGRSIEGMEYLVRKLSIPERVSGILLTMIIVSGTYLVTHAVVILSRQWSALSEIIIGAVIIYFAISVKSLADESKKIMTALKENDLMKARKALSLIVGRDTANLSQEQIVRACVETIAEGSVDGVLSPLFYAFIGGPSAAMAYKAVNTLDSMVGYKSEKYVRFGWASARLDDLANYIPARVSAVLIPIASFLCGCGFKGSLRIAFQDGRKHESPNSGIPEAAIAGALGVQLGGESMYQGEFVEKPFIGNAKNLLTIESIDTAIKIMYVASILFMVCGIGVILCLKYWIF